MFQQSESEWLIDETHILVAIFVADKILLDNGGLAGHWAEAADTLQ